MKKFSFLAAVFAVFFSFASCNLLSSDKISETGRAEFSLSPELARAVVDSLQANEGEENPGIRQNLSIEVKLTGDYTAEKSLQIDVTDLNIEQKSEDLKSKIEAKLTGQTIIFDSIPIGKKITAEVKVYLVSSHGDIQMKKDILVKGKSDPVTISAGDNLISVALSIVYRSYPVTFNLSFEKSGGDFTTCRSVDLYAVKADSDTVLKFFSTFAEGQGSSTDFYNILNSHSNPDCFTEAYWYKDSENKDIDQTAVTEDAMTLSGKIYLPFDEKIIVVALANFTGATDEGLYYICHVPGSSMDEVMSHAFVPDAGGNTVELKSNKLAVSTQYALYKQQDSGGYEYSLAAYPSEAFSPTFTASTDNFCFDADGYFYMLDNNSSAWQIKTNRHDTITLAFSPSSITVYGITVDKKTNVFYLYNYSTYSGAQRIYQFSDLISNGSTDNSNFSVPLNSSDYSPKYFPKLFAVHDGKFYIFANTTNDSSMTALDGRLFTAQNNGSSMLSVDSNFVDFNTELPEIGIDITSDTSISDMIYQDDAVYLLIKESNLRYGDGENNFALTSRGAVIRYDILTERVDKIGWTDSSNGTQFKYGDAAVAGEKFMPVHYGYNIYYEERVYDNEGGSSLSGVKNLWTTATSSADFTGGGYPNQDVPAFITAIPTVASLTSQLCGPQKFIAIKPKKLVIADSGIAFYTDNDGVWKYKNINRVVTVDLNSFTSFDSINTDTALSFAGKNAGYIYLQASGYEAKLSLVGDGEYSWTRGDGSYYSCSTGYAGIPCGDE